MSWTAAKENGNWIVRDPEGRRSSNFWSRWREAKRYAAERNKTQTWRVGPDLNPYQGPGDGLDNTRRIRVETE